MKITINDKEVEAFDGETLIETAGRTGFEIPSLCYAKGYKHKSSCMVCVVRNCDTGAFIPSCTTLPEQGMKIDTESEEVITLRRRSLELLMSDHIAKCVSPCNPKQCRLMQTAAKYKAKFNTYPRYSALKETKPQHIRENMWFDVAKCIRCGLCVYNSDNGFTFKDRGFGMQVFLPEENRVNIPEELVDLCPTGALYKLT